MKKAEREALKIRRLKEMKAFDGQFAEAGRGFVCGVDEVGRGPLAGPVLAAAVVLPDGFDIPGIDDSKKLSDKKRREFNDIILERATAYGFGIRDNSVIDEINILNAAKEAMYDAVREAADMLQTRRESEPGFVLFDAVSLENFPYPQMAIVKGDQKRVLFLDAFRKQNGKLFRRGIPAFQQLSGADGVFLYVIEAAGFGPVQIGCGKKPDAAG